jgi:hypothetical protein
MSSKGFSQSDTIQKPIVLTKPVAKLVIKDLVQYDGLSKEILTVRSLLTETNNKLTTQTQLVANLNSQILNYQSILNNKDGQLLAQNNATEAIEKALKKERRAKKLYQIGSAIGGGAILLLLVQ